MPIREYSLVKGKPAGGSVHVDRDGRSPHYIINLEAGAERFQAAVNIESEDGSEVLYVIDDGFTPPDGGLLADLPFGRTPLDKVAGGLALDYLRSRVNGQFMVDRSSMTLLPVGQAGPASDLHNAVVDRLNQVVADEQGVVYAFGSFYQDAGQPGGIHNIHMNQGNPPDNYGDENGIWQDGALFLQSSSIGGWTAIFIAFQSQSWHTDDQGDPV